MALKIDKERLQRNLENQAAISKERETQIEKLNQEKNKANA